MNKRIRVQSVKTLGLGAFVALAFVAQACGSNSPSTTPGTGGSSTPGTAGSTGTAGTTGVGGTTGTGGTGTGTAGATGTAGTSGAFGDPPCPSSVAKGGACAATDIQFCYKTCGPEKSGVKSETCQTSGTYAEMSGCAFDQAKSYACYKIPTTANTDCPAGVTPQSGMDCGTVPMCESCNSMQGLAGGGYLDSSGSAKTGFCVCQAPNSSGARVWSCATDNGSWPCPGNPGC
jgi:hypothetical protein